MMPIGKTETVSEFDRLSDRELQVMEFLRQGKSNCEIAECLGVSQKTIGTYKARLMEKFGVRTAPELLARLRQNSSFPEERRGRGTAIRLSDGVEEVEEIFDQLLRLGASAPCRMENFVGVREVA
jgi:DNA-binding CsgD family transcriptional regulator